MCPPGALSRLTPEACKRMDSYPGSCHLLCDQNRIAIGIENNPVEIFAQVEERIVGCVSHEVRLANNLGCLPTFTAL